ncbi:MAG: hypothetical protein RMK75_06195 [Aquificaceae bacterium]|nr:hypothetical protein [Aquificaceae bacterium]MCS7277734.1 hypothetical protein [Aquificaceae bacterium]MDW8423894.1 hypothetical protein [Aquificaceae bacterium]
MSQEHWDFVNALIILARFIQVFGFFFAILMLIKEFPISYTFGVFSVNLIGFFAILVGILTGFLSLLGTILADGIIIGVSLLLFFKAYMVKKQREKFPPKPKPFTRCPVCGVFINPELDYCVLMDSKSLLYFDKREHMEAFLKNPEAYKVSKEINYDGVRKICLKKEEGWKKAEEVFKENITTLGL